MVTYQVGPSGNAHLRVVRVQNHDKTRAHVEMLIANGNTSDSLDRPWTSLQFRTNCLWLSWYSVTKISMINQH